MAKTPVFWQSTSLLSTVMLPISWLYKLGFYLNKKLFQLGWRQTYYCPIPVIVVGNLVAGGAGKTPTTIAIVKFLQSKQISVAVVSRGYRSRLSNTTVAREVLVDSNASDVGDEPLLIKQKTLAITYICQTRSLAIKTILNTNPNIQIIICDDGLQHHALARDIEICVFDSRGLGNNRLLPAGPLRECWPHLSTFTSNSINFFTEPCPLAQQITGFTSQRKLACYAINGLGEQRQISKFCKQPVQAIAAIAQPEKFFTMLREIGISIEKSHSRTDHHSYCGEEIMALQLANQAILCTEKDAVKIWQFTPNVWAIPLELTDNPDFFTAIWQQLVNNPKLKTYNDKRN